VDSPDAAQGETSHRWPCFLPDGRRFLYVAFGAAGGTISVGSLDAQAPQPLIGVLSAPSYLSSGQLLYVRDSALRAQAFDAGRTRLIGEAATLAGPVQLDVQMYGGAPVSAGGAVLAYRGGEVNTTQLTWLDREGGELGLVGPPGEYQDPALSPDGTRILVNAAGGRQLALLTLGGGAFVPLTFKSEFVTTHSWSPDGRSIAYGSNRTGRFEIFLAPAGGGGVEERLVHGETTNWGPSFSPDGQLLLYENSDPKTQYDLWVVPLVGDRKPRPFLRTEASEVHAGFSPNGRWVAYTSDTSGRSEVYVRTFPSGEGPWQVSSAGGDQAQWRRDGSELYYLSPDRRLMAVAVNGEGAAFKAAPPKALFRARVRAPGIVAVRNDYVVSADGQRFLVNKLVEDPAKATITVVVNWAARLPS
jgi:WD40 repeat protein